MTRVFPARRADVAATALLGAALPAGFRDRQRGEWLSDLNELRAGGRLRYLIGAVWSLPGLRRSALRHGGGAAGLDGVPRTGAGTAARILLAGLTWPVLSWILFVPARYYALDVPGRLAGGTAEYDPKSLWPLVGTPSWLMPIWIALHLGAWVAMLGGLFLIPSVTLVGALALVRRHRDRLGRLLGVAATATALLMVAMVGLTTGVRTLGAMEPIAGALNGVHTIGVLGILGLLCAARVGDLTRRVRAGLAVIGAAAVGIAAWSYTPAGQAMLTWFLD